MAKKKKSQRSRLDSLRDQYSVVVQRYNRARYRADILNMNRMAREGRKGSTKKQLEQLDVANKKTISLRSEMERLLTAIRKLEEKI